MTRPQRRSDEEASKPIPGGDTPPPSAQRRVRTRPGKLHQEPEAVTWAREKAGLTKRALADQIGVSEQLVGEIESGWRSATPSNLSKIAAALNCPLVALEAKLLPSTPKDPAGQPYPAAAETRGAVRLGGSLNLAEAQRRALDDKNAKAVNPPDVAVQFGLLTTKVGEALAAWRKGVPDFGEELADVVLYAVALAEMNGVDLDAEVARKITKNVDRTYERDAKGTLITTSDS